MQDCRHRQEGKEEQGDAQKNQEKGRFCQIDEETERKKEVKAVSTQLSAYRLSVG